MGFVNWIKRLFGTRRERTLGDIDELSLVDVDRTVSEMEHPYNFQFIGQNKKTCVKCGSGMIERVFPEMVMNGKVLFECSDCKERMYLKNSQ